MSEPPQLALDLPVREALSVEDFLVTPANAMAVELIDAWPAWPASSVLLSGNSGTGKTHLTSVWQAKTGAPRVTYDALSDAAIRRFSAQQALAVEDVAAGGDEARLFHLLNVAREHGKSLLLTSKWAAGDLAIALPDLRSRLRALPAAALNDPDDALLQGLLVKLFDDRQLIVEPNVIAYLLKNMERSAAAARDLVAAIDRNALMSKRRITRRLVSDLLRSK